MSDPSFTPRVGDTISNHLGHWSLLERDGNRINYGRTAERGFYTEWGFVTAFPAYKWDACPECDGPATRYSTGAVPHFDCCREAVALRGAK